MVIFCRFVPLFLTLFSLSLVASQDVTSQDVVLPGQVVEQDSNFLQAPRSRYAKAAATSSRSQSTYLACNQEPIIVPGYSDLILRSDMQQGIAAAVFNHQHDVSKIVVKSTDETGGWFITVTSATPETSQCSDVVSSLGDSLHVNYTPNDGAVSTQTLGSAAVHDSSVDGTESIVDSGLSVNNNHPAYGSAAELDNNHSATGSNYAVTKLDDHVRIQLPAKVYECGCW